MFARQSGDGSVKLAFPAGEGHTFEAAFFHVAGRPRPYIACVSTQVGCAVRCKFCVTQDSGFIRQLTAEEIFRQISSIAAIAIERGAQESEIEISFMGMGEPLANRGALLSAIATAHRFHPEISRVSVSTVGPSRTVRAFVPAAVSSEIPIHLQLSLHATRDSIRRSLIPGTKDTISNLIAAGATFAAATSDQVCLNYVLLDGLNDGNDDAEFLSQIDRRSFYVKLTHLNAQANLPSWVRSAAPDRFDYFGERLSAAGVAFKVFRGDGLDINASCGQLAARPIAIYRSTDFARTA
jgi:23S rRNA (adenine2503-C2)-methyltransferase